MSEPATSASIARWLRFSRRDRWYREQCPFSYDVLGQAINLNGSTVRFAARNIRWAVPDARGNKLQHGLAERPRALLEQAMVAIEGGVLVFLKLNTVTEAMWLIPPSNRPPTQPSIIEDRDWNYWACCRVCGERKRLPIHAEGKAYVACYRCHPPEQWPAFGATPRRSVLVARMMGGAYVSVDDESPVAAPARRVYAYPAAIPT